MSEGQTLREERDRLAQQVAELTANIAKAEARAVIAEGSFHGVTVDHLVDIEPAKMAAKAKELSEANAAAERDVIRRHMAAQFPSLSDTELDAKVTEFMAPQPAGDPTPTPSTGGDPSLAGLNEQERAAVARVRGLGTGGQSLGAAGDMSPEDYAKLSPAQKAELGLQQSESARTAKS